MHTFHPLYLTSAPWQPEKLNISHHYLPLHVQYRLVTAIFSTILECSLKICVCLLRNTPVKVTAISA